MRSGPLRVLAPIALALVASPAFAATALDIDDVWNEAVAGDELNVYEIYNDLYGTNFNSSADLSGLELNSDILNNGMFNFGGEVLTVDAVVRFAGSRQRFGTYTPASEGLPGATLDELFFVNNSNTNPDGTVNIAPVSISPVGDFGFYIDPVGGRADPFVWFSNPTVSPNNGEDHLIVLTTPDPNTYLLVWEDGRFRGNRPLDFNDLVVELTITRNVIPEPASLLLIGMGLSTMAVRRLRKR